MNTVKNNVEKHLLTEAETAEYIRMSRGFLRQDRMNGPRKNRTAGPPFIKIGRSIRYLLEDLEQWLYQNRICRKLLED